VAPTADAIEAGATRLGLALTHAQSVALERFGAMLLRWNAVHNLTAIETGEGVLSHHLLDSLAVLPVIDRIFGDRPLRVLDVGAGGGLPGIPLAIAAPRLSVTLVDKVQKKIAFLTQVKLELGLANIECVHSRIEDLVRPPFDLILSRAFAALDDFVQWTLPLLAAGGWWFAMKGAVPNDEIEAVIGAGLQVRIVDTVKLDVPRLGAERHLILLQRS
jgi:16S rRNA (guanine527-N7)-methyltransferase